ncbi:uncharacterized protein LOC142772063 [Rhipicephalus microplus]|uniref:uncharacterized protein LOC142772063 n=1 Tax=Rhipicephalus microplus TaxID=6941 RepID=UPI003F6A6108
MYRIKLKVQTHPLNTRITKRLLAASSLFTIIILSLKLYRIVFPHGVIREADLPGWFNLDAFVPDRIPSDLLPDMYTLSVNVTETAFSGNVTIKVICRHSTSYLILHAASSLVIHTVSVEVSNT